MSEEMSEDTEVIQAFDPWTMTAKEAIAKIGELDDLDAAQSVLEREEERGEDARVTVVQAAEERLAELAAEGPVADAPNTEAEAESVDTEDGEEAADEGVTSEGDLSIEGTISESRVSSEGTFSGELSTQSEADELDRPRRDSEDAPEHGLMEAEGLGAGCGTRIRYHHPSLGDVYGQILKVSRGGTYGRIQIEPEGSPPETLECSRGSGPGEWKVAAE